MLDRLISGAGALTDRADRLVRLFTSGRGPDVIANRPGSVIVIILFIGTAVVFGLLAIEATDNPTPRTLAPVDLYRYTSTGVVVRDPAYVGVDVAQFNQLAGTEAFELLSFDSKEERDRAAGELIGESGLLIQGSMAGGAG